MLYRTCEYCGAHLDPGEPCDCRNGGAATDIQYKTKKEEEEADEFYKVPFFFKRASDGY